MPVPSAIVAPPVGPERTTRNVSVGSAVRSPTIAIVNVAVVGAGRERHRAALGLEVGAGRREAGARRPRPAWRTRRRSACSRRPTACSVTVTVVVFLSPSVTLTSCTVIDGAGGGGGATSSSTIATFPVPSAIVRPCGSDSRTVKPSRPSTEASPITVTVIVAVVWPGRERHRAGGVDVVRARHRGAPPRSPRRRETGVVAACRERQDQRDRAGRPERALLHRRVADRHRRRARGGGVGARERLVVRAHLHGVVRRAAAARDHAEEPVHERGVEAPADDEGAVEDDRDGRAAQDQLEVVVLPGDQRARRSRDRRPTRRSVRCGRSAAAGRGRRAPRTCTRSRCSGRTRCPATPVVRRRAVSSR